MTDIKQEVSQSKSFLIEYNILLQKVKQRFKVKDHKWIKISKSKASRVLNGQFDIITLIKMAVFVGYDVELFFKQRKY
jgi:hypothetical protein